MNQELFNITLNKDYEFEINISKESLYLKNETTIILNNLKMTFMIIIIKIK